MPASNDRPSDSADTLSGNSLDKSNTIYSINKIGFNMVAIGCVDAWCRGHGSGNIVTIHPANLGYYRPECWTKVIVQGVPADGSPTLAAATPDAEVATLSTRDPASTIENSRPDAIVTTEVHKSARFQP